MKKSGKKSPRFCGRIILVALLAALFLGSPISAQAIDGGRSVPPKDWQQRTKTQKCALRKQTRKLAVSESLIRSEWEQFADLSLEQVLSLAIYRSRYEAQAEDILNRFDGTTAGPSGKETYYNLDMSGVIDRLRLMGIEGEYHIREDGVKMYGDYIMCAACFDFRPIGTILETSLGEAIVCDTGTFVYTDPYQIDIAVAW